MQKSDQPIRSGGPMARQLAKALKLHILKHCSAGDRLPPETALARQYRRSATTVRAALSMLVAEGLIERQVGSGTYVSDALPRRTGTTAFVYFGRPDTLLRTIWSCDVYLGILSAATDVRRHVHLAMGEFRRPSEVTEDLARQIDLSLIDSVICLEIFNYDVLAQFGKHVPTIAVDYACYADGVSSCSLDHRHDVAEAVNHLRRAGHRRIALVGNVDPRRPDPAVLARRDGFRLALAAHNLPFRGHSVIPVSNATEAIRVIRDWATADPGQRPTAIICINCLWAVAEAAIEFGVQIPRQISLVGIGEDSTWANALQTRQGKNMTEFDVQMSVRGETTDWMDPRFESLRSMQASQVCLPFAEMGKWAVDEVLRRLAEPDSEPRHELFRGSIGPGNSVASPIA